MAGFESANRVVGTSPTIRLKEAFVFSPTILDWRTLIKSALTLTLVVGGVELLNTCENSNGASSSASGTDCGNWGNMEGTGNFSKYIFGISFEDDALTLHGDMDIPPEGIDVTVFVYDDVEAKRECRKAREFFRNLKPGCDVSFPYTYPQFAEVGFIDPETGKLAQSFIHLPKIDESDVNIPPPPKK